MILLLLYWLLVTLVAISLTGNHPVWALLAGGAGGMALGVAAWRRQSGLRPGPAHAPKGQPPPAHAPRGQPSQPSPPSQAHPPDQPHQSHQSHQSHQPHPSNRWLVYSVQYQPLLALPGILLLAFPNRLPLWVAAAGLVWLVVLGLCRWAAWGRPWKRTPLDLPIALLLVLTATLGLWASPDRALTIQGVFKLLAGAGLFYTLAGSLHSERLRLAAWVYLGVGVLGACASLVAVGPRLTRLPLARAVFGHLPSLGVNVNPNYVAGALTLFVPMAFWGLLLVSGRARLAYGVAVLATAGTMVLTLGRGALLGTGIALAVTAVWAGRWVRWAAVLALVAGGVLLYTVGVDALLDPVGGASVERTWEGRKELWQRAVYISQDFAFTGIGMGSFPVVVDLLYPLFLIGPNARMPHAHNLYLHVVATAGFPGFVALWMLLATCAGMLWDLLRCTRSGTPAAGWRPTVLGLMGGCLAFLLYSVTDAIVLWEKAALAFWALLGLTVGLWSCLCPATSMDQGEGTEAPGVPDHMDQGEEAEGTGATEG